MKEDEETYCHEFHDKYHDLLLEYNDKIRPISFIKVILVDLCHRLLHVNKEKMSIADVKIFILNQLLEAFQIVQEEMHKEKEPQ